MNRAMLARVDERHPRKQGLKLIRKAASVDDSIWSMSVIQENKD